MTGKAAITYLVINVMEKNKSRKGAKGWNMAGWILIFEQRVKETFCRSNIWKKDLKNNCHKATED